MACPRFAFSFWAFVGSLILATWDASWAQDSVDFRQDIQPLLASRCYKCHGPNTSEGGLRLHDRKAAIATLESGAQAIVPGKPEASALLTRVTSTDESTRMPPEGKPLTTAQVDLLKRWIASGAEFRNHWAFEPVVRPTEPHVKQSSWVRNSIDAFVLERLEKAGLQPAAPASKTSLLRRVYFDLIGLPPTPAQTANFLADQAPNAYEKVVEQLLASPHYGEHWARHWLDVVRYAESNSFERDGAKPFVWRYRDYVIRSFNNDKPYGRFVREQLAGDELDAVTDESLIATGYYRLGPWDDEPADPVQALYDDLDDIVSTTGQAFLGLTVNCARCHDHKFDPFPQQDYYRLLAFFHGIQRFGVRKPETIVAASLRPIASAEEQARQRGQIAAYQREIGALTQKLKAVEDAVRERLEGGERDDFEHEQNRLPILRKHVPDLLSAKELDAYVAVWRQRDTKQKFAPSALAQALCVTEIGPTPRETFVLGRGNHQARGQKVEPGFPSALDPTAPVLPDPGAEAKTSGRRRVLADWIADPHNPLAIRVIVNRVWQHHFGRGIVRSSNNFGFQGTPPTHPELLDWLCSEFVASGERFKPLHNLILLSNTYRMSANPAHSEAIDPENNLLGHFSLRRLSAEEVRDAILSVCGNLNSKMYGPSIYPEIPRDVLFGQSYPGWGWDMYCPPDERSRRSVYIHVKRSLTVPLLAAFDAADTDGSCPVRFSTTQPTQALAMLNSDFLNEQAARFAQDLRQQAGDHPTEQVQLALQRVMQREPSSIEVDRGVRLISKLRLKKLTADEALRAFCLLTLNLNEFVYLD
jgi:mono/diheme cytochrome c family protein